MPPATCQLPTATCPAILQFNNPFPFRRLPPKYSARKKDAKNLKLEFAFKQPIHKKWQTICFYGKTKNRKHCEDILEPGHFSTAATPAPVSARDFLLPVLVIPFFASDLCHLISCLVIVADNLLTEADVRPDSITYFARFNYDPSEVGRTNR